MKPDFVRKKLFLVISVLVVISFFALFTSMTSKSLAKGQIQYKVAEIAADTSEIQKTLDQYGREGWELVAFSARGHFVFKK